MSALEGAPAWVDGWLSSARHCPSPFFDRRPREATPELVVVHAMSLPAAQFGTGCPAALFEGVLDCSAHAGLAALRDVRVSAHFLIERDARLTQFVGVLDRAWHAGESSWQGRAACNDYSIGIELEGCDDLPFTEAQYQALAALLGALRSVVTPLGPDNIVGHSDIAPGRKTDPGPAFDWERLYQLLNTNAEN